MPFKLATSSFFWPTACLYGNDLKKKYYSSAALISFWFDYWWLSCLMILSLDFVFVFGKINHYRSLHNRTSAWFITCRIANNVSFPVFTVQLLVSSSTLHKRTHCSSCFSAWLWSDFIILYWFGSITLPTKFLHVHMSNAQILNKPEVNKTRQNAIKKVCQ